MISVQCLPRAARFRRDSSARDARGAWFGLSWVGAVRYDRGNEETEETLLGSSSVGARSAGTVCGSQAMVSGLINRIKELSGVYGLGFERESMMGIGLPIGFVLVVGGLGWAFVKLFL